nr:hypothetical protein [Victivallis vadensis]
MGRILPAVLRGSCAGLFLKSAIKRFQIPETGFLRDLPDTQCAFNQQLACGLYPVTEPILVRRDIELLLEERSEVNGAVSGADQRKFLPVDVFIQMFELIPYNKYLSGQLRSAIHCYIRDNKQILAQRSKQIFRQQFRVCFKMKILQSVMNKRIQ